MTLEQTIPGTNPKLYRGNPGGSDNASGKEVNVGPSERVVSGLLGGALLVWGVQARSLAGALGAIAGGALVHRGVTGHCQGYAGLHINTARREPAPPEAYNERGIHVEESLTINRFPWDLYQFWRNFENLPRFMHHLESVTVKDNDKSHWVIRGPLGVSVGWDAEIINDEPNALIAWRSLGEAAVDNSGSVRFIPGPEGRGTEVKVVIDYIPPAGQLGRWANALFGTDPSTKIREDLRRFKQVMEAGEIPTTKGQPHGNGG